MAFRAQLLANLHAAEQRAWRARLEVQEAEDEVAAARAALTAADEAAAVAMGDAGGGGGEREGDRRDYAFLIVCPMRRQHLWEATRAMFLAHGSKPESVERMMGIDPEDQRRRERGLHRDTTSEKDARFCEARIARPCQRF